MRERLRAAANFLRREFAVCWLVLSDKRTPWAAKLLFGLVVAYTLSPIDLIPDYRPLIGIRLDDALIVPALAWGALRLVPDAVVADSRERVYNEQQHEGDLATR